MLNQSRRTVSPRVEYTRNCNGNNVRNPPSVVRNPSSLSLPRVPVRRRCEAEAEAEAKAEARREAEAAAEAEVEVRRRGQAAAEARSRREAVARRRLFWVGAEMTKRCQAQARGRGACGGRREAGARQGPRLGASGMHKRRWRRRRRRRRGQRRKRKRSAGGPEAKAEMERRRELELQAGYSVQARGRGGGHGWCREARGQSSGPGQSPGPGSRQ